MSQSNECIDCGKPCDSRAKRCQVCYEKFLDSKRMEVPCYGCGKKLRVSSYEAKRKNFCSEECRLKYLENRKIDLKCKYCGKAFTVTPSLKNRKYCSWECFKKDVWEPKEISIPKGVRGRVTEELLKKYRSMKGQRRQGKVRHKIRAYMILSEGKPIKCAKHGEWGCCGDPEDVRVLSIDHINGDGAEHKRELGNKTLNTWVTQNPKEARERLQIICMNAQLMKRKRNNE